MATLISQGQGATGAEGAQDTPAQGTPASGQQPAGTPASTGSFALPDAYKAEKVFESVKSVDDVFKMALEGQKMIGRGIFLPDEKDPDDVKADKWNKVYNKLGRPDQPEEYDTKVKVTLPEGMEWDKEMIGSFQKLAHQSGLTKSQFSSVLNFYAELMNKGNADPAVAARETKDALVKEWGENGYELRMNEAFAASRLIGGQEFLDFLDETHMGDHPVMIKFLSKIGRDLREDGVIDDSIIHGIRSSGDYEAEAKSILNDPKDPYNQPKHAQHKERVAYVNKLWEMSTK